MRDSKQSNPIILLELIFVIIIISLLLSTAVKRLWGLQATGERLNVAQTIKSLQDAMDIQAVVYQGSHGKEDTGVKENCINPMNYLSTLPNNYMGEYRTIDPQTMKPGYWYFQSEACELDYRVVNRDSFYTGGTGIPLIRLRTRIIYTTTQEGTPTFGGFKVEPIRDYHWLD